MITENERVFNLATRISLYTEDVKEGQTGNITQTLNNIKKLLKEVLNNVKYDNLGKLSKTNLELLISKVRKFQQSEYTAYIDKTMANLRAFSDIQREVNKIVWATHYVTFDTQKDETIKPLSYEETEAVYTEESESSLLAPLLGFSALTDDGAKLWNSITNTAIPANGLYVLPFLKTFSASAQASVERAIRKAWAQKLTVNQTIQLLMGDGANEFTKTNEIKKIKNQSDAVTHTIYAQAASIAAASTASAFFRRYVWNSVIDSGTTVICRRRNKKTYVYGLGPLPPAHVRCRSSTAPVSTSGDIVSISFFNWIAQQPYEIQVDHLGIDQADFLNSEDVNAEEFDAYQTHKPLTFSQFKNKINKILIQ